MKVIYVAYPLVAYLLGSIHFGLILSNIFGDGKLRERGSRNVGATNVLRTQGKLLGALTLILDFFKSFLPCYFLKTDCEIVNLIILTAPAIGHMFSIWMKFKGGKGVASYFGALCAIDFLTFAITGAIWICIFIISRISSLACLISINLSCIIFAFIKYWMNLHFFNQLCVLIPLAVFINIKHKENIKRLLSGNELKL